MSRDTGSELTLRATCPSESMDSPLMLGDLSPAATCQPRAGCVQDLVFTMALLAARGKDWGLSALLLPGDKLGVMEEPGISTGHTAVI